MNRARHRRAILVGAAAIIVAAALTALVVVLDGRFSVADVQVLTSTAGVLLTAVVVGVGVVLGTDGGSTLARAVHHRACVSRPTGTVMSATPTSALLRDAATPTFCAIQPTAVQKVVT